MESHGRLESLLIACSARCGLSTLAFIQERISKIRDPVLEQTYQKLWLATAEGNSMIFQDVFACIPNNRIHSRAALRQDMAHWKEKLGHTTIDLGVAPEKLETKANGEIKITDPMESKIS